MKWQVTDTNDARNHREDIRVPHLLPHLLWPPSAPYLSHSTTVFQTREVILKLASALISDLYTLTE